MPTVGALALDYLADQAAAVRDGEHRLRAGDADVHDFRVAVRRLRSALRSYADLFDAEPRDALERELRWFAGLLGAVRDAQVLQARLLDAVAALPPELVRGPVRDRVDTELGTRESAALHTVCGELNGSRYAALAAEVERWGAHPPLTSVRRRRARDLESYVDVERSRLRTRLRRIRRRGASDTQVHSARKAAKRCRYAAELAAPAMRRSTVNKRTHRMQKVQDDLGEFQDSVVAAEALLVIRDRAATAAEDGFTYGVLYEQQRQLARAARQRVQRRSL